MWRAVLGDKFYDAVKKKGFYRGLGVPINGGANEESIRRGLEDSNDQADYFVIKVFGGNGCNGAPLEQIIIKADTCLGFYDVIPEGDDADGIPNIPDIENHQFIIEKDGIELVKKYYTYGPASRLTRCQDPDSKDNLIQINYVKELMSYYYDADLYETSQKIPDPEIGKCTSFMVSKMKWKFNKNMDPRTLYVSVSVEGLSKLVGESNNPDWIPSSTDMALHPSLSEGAGYIGSAGFDFEKKSGLYYYRPAEVGSCLSRSGTIDVNAQSISKSARQPISGAREYSISSDLSGFEGPYGIDSGNEDLFPTASGQQYFKSLQLRCSGDGGWKIHYFADDHCKSERWSASYSGRLIRSYIHGAGLANHRWFNKSRPTGVQTSKWDETENIPVFHKLACSGAGVQPYPKPGLMSATVSTTSATSRSWAYAQLFTDSQCRGSVYAHDSMAAGKLLQCMPDPDTIIEGKGFMAGSFLIECLDTAKMFGEGSGEAKSGNNLRGFYKRLFNDMECGKEVTNIPPVTRPSYGQANAPDEGSFAWNNPYINNGSCVPNQIQDEYNLFQTKSYKYVCTDKPPQGMGYTVSRFSRPDCGGILTWAKTFDIKLGTNDSAPSNANDAKPSHAAYTVRSQCLDSGELSTTWTSRNAEMVEIQTYTSTVPNICIENPARAINEDSPIKDSHMFICNSPQKPPPEPQLSEGEIAGIALGCSFAVLLFIAGLFYFLVYAPIKQKEQALHPSLFTETITVGEEVDAVPPESTEYDGDAAGSLSYTYPSAGSDGGAQATNPMYGDTTGNATL